jgi:hypothetical protein
MLNWMSWRRDSPHAREFDDFREEHPAIAKRAQEKAEADLLELQSKSTKDVEVFKLHINKLDGQLKDVD